MATLIAYTVANATATVTAVTAVKAVATAVGPVIKTVLTGAVGINPIGVSPIGVPLWAYYPTAATATVTATVSKRTFPTANVLCTADLRPRDVKVQAVATVNAAASILIGQLIIAVGDSANRIICISADTRTIFIQANE